MLQDEDFKEEGVKLIFVLQGRKSSFYELHTVNTHTDPSGNLSPDLVFHATQRFRVPPLS